MFNEFILYISNPDSRFIILHVYITACIAMIMARIRARIRVIALRFIMLTFAGFIITIITYLSIRFLITRQIFSDVVYFWILFACCAFTVIAVNILHENLNER